MICFGFLVIFACQAPALPTAQSAAAFCAVARPILWSPADTRASKEAIDEHNAVGKKLCHWGSKK